MDDMFQMYLDIPYHLIKNTRISRTTWTSELVTELTEEMKQTLKLKNYVIIWNSKKIQL